MGVKEHPVNAYREQLQVVLESKADEFKLLGYDQVTAQEIWDCLMSKKWKQPEEIKLYQLVNDVLALSSSDYMTYLTMEAYKAPLRSFEEYENN
ncbi:post-transcriptional regulator [Ectobacillus antri]|uniref:Post-transcriptional regulator n=1 Tax=Ectobacillus antri TaxID=2486280 RepID=A0ABT6H302_9BACI|nr:post-transcriptional regulator [Ectobacillus antri]MDG4655400.1 post-transcriptional regulator [Ectobacillus antri]MDG5753158.1 post-transcriptional regulator [Ectobacillus antri]